jgi:hypothetical protein
MVREDEKGAVRIGSIYGREVKCIGNFGEKTQGKKHLEDLGVAA